MTSEKETKLHDQAIKEILAEVKRGEDRSKTLGTSGWQRPKVASVNKQFLKRTIFSAALSTIKTSNRTQNGRSRLEKKSSKDYKRSSSVENDQKHLKRSSESSNGLSSSNSTLKKSRHKREDQTKEVGHKKAKIESVKS